ncbi:hypothetical protein Vadar_031337 [Vaccinium darrowii]|uniref:Uncharacterized protein n=1 Tax=Vaccinium darrowii TaxID=229202 RepID=A0ACB7YZV6_9ERIC|nr:hypothetical protein Vadar_031337 [Vaccinium darrowii]
MHLGNYTSNRAECAHAKLKNHLGSSQCNFARLWEQIDKLINLQITELKGTFERELSCWQHEFRIPLLDDIRGVVSKEAMRTIMKKANEVEILVASNRACECSIRRTHGLPCSHEIAPFKIDNKPLPLSIVHDHWKKLFLVAPAKDPSITETVKADWDIFFRRLQETTEEQQRHMMKKFKEFVHPECTSLVEPQHKARGRGRPKKDKSSISTRRLPLEFEHVEASVSTPKPVKEIPRRKPKKSGVKSIQQSLQSVNPVKDKPRAIPKVCAVESSKPKVATNLIRNMYLSEFPEPIRQDIHIIKDVKSDGNCGYRAIAALMGGMEEE